MPWAQWVVFTIINCSDLSNKTLVIKNLQLSYGIFHKNGHKDKAIDAWLIEGTEIPFNKQQFTFSSCGSTFAGTTGSFDILIKEEGKKLCHCYWDCPYWSHNNTWTLSEHNPKWIIQDAGASPTGPLGHITISAYHTTFQSPALE